MKRLNIYFSILLTITSILNAAKGDDLLCSQYKNNIDSYLKMTAQLEADSIMSIGTINYSEETNRLLKINNNLQLIDLYYRLCIHAKCTGIPDLDY